MFGWTLNPAIHEAVPPFQDDCTDDNAWWGISWQLRTGGAHAQDPVLGDDRTPIVIHEVPPSFADPLNLHAGQPGGPLAGGRRVPPFPACTRTPFPCPGTSATAQSAGTAQIRHR
jgi:hypothetical protein